MNTNYRDVIADRNHAVGPRPTTAPVRREPATTATCGSGWYHDVAIQQSREVPVRKH